MNCTSVYEFDKDRQRSLQYYLEIEPLPEDNRTFVYEGKRYAVCGVHLLLERTRQQIFFQVYLTSTMFVVVSWVSFIIKPDVVPGRMGVLVTIFLVLINIFNNVKGNAPVPTSLNAVDLYLIICIFIVFLALLEYAIVLFKERYKTEIDAMKPGISSIQAAMSSTKKSMEKFKMTAWPEHTSTRNKLDTMSLIIFPIVFIIFIIIYCIIHI